MPWSNPFDIEPIAAVPLPGQSVEPETEAVDVFPTPPGRRLSLTFDGSVLEYYRLWILCQAITLITLGLYGPWAKVRKARYLHRHTKLDDVPFIYQADPKRILRGRLLLAVILFGSWVLSWAMPYSEPILVFGGVMLGSWLLARSWGFQWRAVSYRNICFSGEADTKRVMRAVWPVALLSALFALQLVAAASGVTSIVIQLLMMVGLVVLLRVGPRATSTLLHERISSARYGATDFQLATNPEKIVQHMWRLTGSVIYVGVGSVVVLMLFAHIFPPSTVTSLAYSLLGIVPVIFVTNVGRARRANFILNHLS